MNPNVTRILSRISLSNPESYTETNTRTEGFNGPDLTMKTLGSKCFFKRVPKKSKESTTKKITKQVLKNRGRRFLTIKSNVTKGHFRW